MSKAPNQRVLVLGATGKTGSRVAGKLTERAVGVRTAARTGAGVHFDWDDVLAATGTEPISFAEFAAQAAPAWKQAAAS